MHAYSTMLSPMLSFFSVLWPLHICFAGAFSIDAKWTDLSHQVNIVTPPRSGHVAFAPADEPYSPRIFGGYIEEKDGPTGEITRYAGNDMWKWCGAGQGWSKVDYADENVMPQPRLAAAMCLVKNRPVLFGGWDPQTPGTGGVILDTLEEFDTTSNAWKANVIDARMLPDGPTSRHVALNLPDGTAMIHNHRCTDHVMIYSDSGFHKQSTTGPAPSSRGLHAATVAGGKAVVFGGAEQSGTMNNEVFVLDTNTWEWRAIQIENSECVPCPRAAPCLVATADNCVLLFGGAEATSVGLNPRGDLWALHLNPDEGSGRWELLIDDKGGGGSVLEGCPPPRNAATLSEIEPTGAAEAWNVPAEDGEIRKSFVLQGGWHPFVRTYNDCFTLSVSLKQ